MFLLMKLNIIWFIIFIFYFNGMGYKFYKLVIFVKFYYLKKVFILIIIIRIKGKINLKFIYIYKLK